MPHHCQPTLYARYSPYLKYLPINHRHKLSHLMDAGNPQCTYRWCQNSKHSLTSLISILGTALLDIDLPFSQSFSLTACTDVYAIQPNDHLQMCRFFYVSLLMCCELFLYWENYSFASCIFLYCEYSTNEQNYKREGC